LEFYIVKVSHVV